MEKDLVKRAHAAFNQGDYQNAIKLYQNAASQYGKSLFDVNVRLCEQKLGNPGQATKTAPRSVDNTPVAKQLAETQALLEHYYRRCQDLEYHLQDAS